MRRVYLAIGVFWGAFVAGCANVDGGFTYDLHGQLIDPHGQPLSGRPIAIQLHAFTPTTRPERDTTTTSAEGQFSQSAGTGTAWGYAKLLGIIPLGNTHPERPPLTEVFVAIEKADGGGWTSVVVPVPAQPGPNTSSVDLGRIVVEP